MASACRDNVEFGEEIQFAFFLGNEENRFRRLISGTQINKYSIQASHSHSGLVTTLTSPQHQPFLHGLLVH